MGDIENRRRTRRGLMIESSQRALVEIAVHNAQGRSVKVTHGALWAGWRVRQRQLYPLVNQNYDRFWRLTAGRGTVISQGGLLAVSIPAGRQTLWLSYW